MKINKKYVSITALAFLGLGGVSINAQPTEIKKVHAAIPAYSPAHVAGMIQAAGQATPGIQ